MAQEVARAVVDLDGAQAGAELKKLEARAKDLRQELTRLGADNDLAGFRQREKELKLVQKQMKDLKKSTWDVEQVLSRLSGASFNDLTRAQRQLNSEIKRMSVNTKEEVAAYRKKVDQLRRVNVQLDKMKKEMQAAKVSQQGWLSSAANGFNKYFGIITAGLATITGVVFSIKSLIQGNVELDDSLADVMKTTGLAKKEVRELYSEFKTFNTRTPRRELLALAVEAGRLGKKSKKDIMDFVVVANQIKVALGDDLGGNAEVAIREVGKLTEIYRVGQKYGVDFRQSMLMVGSSINEVSANSQAQAGYLIELTKRMAGVSSQAGIGVQDIIGYAAALDSMGQSGEVSATTLNKVIVNMYKDVATYAELAGMKQDEFNQLLSVDANEALIKVLEGLNGNNQGLSEMAGKLDGLGLDGSRSVQVLASLASNIELIRKQQDLANSSLEQATSLTNEYNVKNNNMAGNLEKINRAFKAVFINSGINQALTNIISKVTKWIEIPVSETMEDQRMKINLLTIELTNANTQEQRRKEIWEELQGLAPEILEGISQEAINIDLLRINLAKYNEEAIRKIALQRAGEKLAEVQEELGGVQAKKAAKEVELMEAFFLGQKRSAHQYKEQSVRIGEISVSSLDILDKQRQISEIVGKINADAGYLAVNMGATENIARDIVNLREKENDLLAESTKELENYQFMYKSIMGIGTEETPGVGNPTFPPDDTTTTTTTPTGSGSLNQEMVDAAAAFRMRIINESKTLIEQEELAYQERLKNAGIFMKEKADMTDEELQAAEILDQQHQENIKKINENALSDELLDLQKNFDRVTTLRQTAHNNELAAIGNDEEAKKALQEQFNKEELERQQSFLLALLAELQATLDGQDVFQGIDETLLSDEQKEALRLRIDEVRLMLSMLGVDLANLKSGESSAEDQKSFGEGLQTDIFGMTPDAWVQLIDNIRTGNMTLEDTIQIVGALTEAWAMYSQIRSNLENQAMMDYESQVNRKKDLLKNQLKNGIISQESYNEKVEALDEEVDKRKRDLAIKQAKREKSTALIGAIVNTALGVVKMLSSSEPPLNFILAALVGLMGGLQIATIASEPIPQYATGRYDVIGKQDGKKYSARMIDSPGTGLVNEPTILVGEKPEIIIDPYTTRNLQVNYPEVIEAIQAARVPQYATGSFPASMKETVTERPLPKEFYEIMAGLTEENRKLNEILNKGIGAKLVADGDYITAHNDVMDDYDTLRNQVDLRD